MTMTQDHVLRDAFRRWGYLQADLDPFGRLPPIVHEELEAATGSGSDRWREHYCGPIGAEFMHILDAGARGWMAGALESDPEPVDREAILRTLAEAELFERFLHKRYVGTKRYSLEGSAALVPLLREVLETAAGEGAETSLIAMAHRGRLTVMVHVVGTPARHLFTHFEDAEPRGVLGGGDVRFHLGATGRRPTRAGRDLHLHLVSNPSHLEAVDPVLVGRARARQDRSGGDGVDRVVPVMVHGDAALAGQGIASETLNLGGVPGFDVGGTIHIVVNNLIGFTTPPRSLHGSRYATDAVRRLPAPILHVNGSVPEAVVRAGRIAMRYRARFHTDVVIDLIGFRRYGHSEVDDPTTTQPKLYRAIEETPMLWESYAEVLGKTDEEREALERECNDRFAAEHDEGLRATKRTTLRRLPEFWSAYRGGPWKEEYEVGTAVPAERLGAIAEAITAVPDGFSLHPKVARGLEARRAMGRGDEDVDWGMAEALAFGSLLMEGTRIRLTGQDTRRGTFNHRHGVLFDTQTEEEYVPLAHVSDDQAPFGLHDSTLSEAAVLGFEYGYSRDAPDALVCWEAQFGDFANGAQVIIDQFLASGEDKWNLLSGLVLLLPHGYEGQGPEHSSARLERFLQLAAEDNIQVCQPTTASQYFHLLRRQALRAWRKPLVVMTPKSLLRAASASSPLRDLAEGGFRPVIGDDRDDVRRLLVGSGKVVHDLRAARKKREIPWIGVVALEQIYPFPGKELADAIEAHAGAEEIVWVQEEPANMGALGWVRARLERIAGRPVTAVHRSPSASPATGSLAAHRVEQEALLDLALRDPGAGRAEPTREESRSRD